MQCHDTTYRFVRDDAEGYLDPFVCVALLRFLFRRPLFRSLGVSPSIIKIKWAFRNAFLFSRVTAQRRLGRLLVRTGSVRCRLSRFYRDHRGATRRLAPPPAANTRNSCRSASIPRLAPMTRTFDMVFPQLILVFGAILTSTSRARLTPWSKGSLSLRSVYVT